MWSIVHRYYGGIPDGISPKMLVKMIEQGIHWDIEQDIKPLWYLRVIKDALSGLETTVTISQMLDEAMASQAQPVREAEDITSDFMALINRDRAKGG